MDFYIVVLLVVACFITGKTLVESGKLLLLCYRDLKAIRLEKEIDWHYKLGLYETIQMKIGKVNSL